MNASTTFSSFIAARVSPETAGGPAPGRIQLFPAGEFSARDGRPAQGRQSQGVDAYF